MDQSILIDEDPIARLTLRNAMTFGSRMRLYCAYRSKSTVTTEALVGHVVLTVGESRSPWVIEQFLFYIVSLGSVGAGEF